jgi:hypothetical protein
MPSDEGLQKVDGTTVTAFMQDLFREELLLKGAQGGCPVA